jgi:hypothetical protein
MSVPFTKSGYLMASTPPDLFLKEFGYLDDVFLNIICNHAASDVSHIREEAVTSPGMFN